MSMPGIAMDGDRRAGWELSVPEEPLEVIERRHAAIAAPVDRLANPEGGQGFDAPADDEEFEQRSDEQDPDDAEARKQRNREYSQAGQQRRQYRESLWRIGQDLDKDGNVIVTNPAVYRGYLEANGMLPSPQQQQAQQQVQREEPNPKPGPQAPAAVEVPPINDPNDPMPDVFEAEDFAAWQARREARIVAHATAVARNEMQQQQFQLQQQIHQQQEELNGRFGQMLSPVEQSAAFQALQVAHQSLPQRGMGALLQVPEFGQKLQDALKQGNVPLENWTNPETLNMVAGVLMTSDPALFNAVMEAGVQQRLQQQNPQGNNPQNLGTQAPPQNPYGMPQYQQPYQQPANQQALMAQANRGAYGQFGATTGGGRQETQQYAPDVQQAAKVFGMSPERAALLSNPRLTPEELAEFDAKEAAKQQRRRG